MTEKELMMIKRDLQRRAKKKGFGKKRAGAYVFGTLRRVRGNPRCEEVYDDNYDDKEMILVREKTLKPVCVGQKLKDFRGDTAILEGGRAPHKPASQGKVWVKEGTSQREYYASVFGLKWVPSVNIFPVDKVTSEPRYKLRGNPNVSTFADAGLRIVKQAGRVFRGAPEFIVAVPVDGTRREIWEIDPQGRGGLESQGFNYSPASFMRSRREGSPYKSKGGFRRIPGMTDLPRYLRGNPVRTKTWKLGEYGGNIKALVNDSRTAVQIVHSDKPLVAGAYGRLFRWPLDRFELEMYLNNLTTSYYASKVIDWVESVAKGVNNNPILTKIERFRRIFDTRQSEVIQGTRVDTYSASAVVTVYDKLDSSRKAMFAKMSVPKMISVANGIVGEQWRADYDQRQG